MPPKLCLCLLRAIWTPLDGLEARLPQASASLPDIACKT